MKRNLKGNLQKALVTAMAVTMVTSTPIVSFAKEPMKLDMDNAVISARKETIPVETKKVIKKIERLPEVKEIEGKLKEDKLERINIDEEVRVEILPIKEVIEINDKEDETEDIVGDEELMPNEDVMLINTELENTDMVTVGPDFRDFDESHWAYNDVLWGIEHGLVSGYEDGTYKPEAEITEEEFVAVLARYLVDEFEIKRGQDWSEPYYTLLEKYDLPIEGYEDAAKKKEPITRGKMAQIVAAVDGYNFGERQAVYYMYENEISYGMEKEVVSFEAYGKDLTVERAQIPAFFKRIDGLEGTVFRGEKAPEKEGKAIIGIKDVKRNATILPDEHFKYLEGVIYGENEMNSKPVTTPEERDGEDVEDIMMAD